MNTSQVGKLVLLLIIAVALSGCQNYSKRYRMVQKNLKESYKNGDITREEYDEASGRYRKAAKDGNTGVQTPEGDFSF